MRMDVPTCTVLNSPAFTKLYAEERPMSKIFAISATRYVWVVTEGTVLLLSAFTVSITASFLNFTPIALWCLAIALYRIWLSAAKVSFIKIRSNLAYAIVSAKPARASPGKIARNFGTALIQTYIPVLSPVKCVKKPDISP